MIRLFLQKIGVSHMTSLNVAVPDELLSAAGSEAAMRALMLEGAAAQLVRDGRLAKDAAAVLLEDAEWQQLADTGHSFDFWNDECEDIYSPGDGEPV